MGGDEGVVEQGGWRGEGIVGGSKMDGGIRETWSKVDGEEMKNSRSTEDGGRSKADKGISSRT